MARPERAPRQHAGRATIFGASIPQILIFRRPPLSQAHSGARTVLVNELDASGLERLLKGHDSGFVRGHRAGSGLKSFDRRQRDRGRVRQVALFPSQESARCADKLAAKQKSRLSHLVLRYHLMPRVLTAGNAMIQYLRHHLVRENHVWSSYEIRFDRQ